MPGEIDRNHAVAVGERGVLAIPEGLVGHAAVDEDESGIGVTRNRIRDGDAVERGDGSGVHDSSLTEADG